MTEPTGRTTTPPDTAADTAAVPGTPRGDLGRRLAARRAQLGLTREEAAERAGMAPGYLRYLEGHPEAAPGAEVLLRLADALETTVPDLTGGTVDQPPGPGQAARGARFESIGTEECRALLGDHGVGRLAVVPDDGPVVVPVNYTVVDNAIVFRTAANATPALADGERVAFEVDRIDDAFSRGWSVLVRGDARIVTDPGERDELAERAYSGPWAGGTRDVWVRLDPDAVTGRRITA
ncbi:pyridoxamine 5'-phosphate oxidase family protein [Streptomyces sp. NPDC047024]|uniref:helix-turn-helix domain-containing protein n=1 Tax=Streptomyces sp. NPDC047024 TaxID=3155476 RepID=UPI0033E2D7D6